MPRVRFPLYKLFLVVAAYALTLGGFAPLETPGVLLGALVGSALSGIILFARKEDVPAVIAVALGSLLGGAIAWIYVAPEIVMGRPYGYEHGVWGMSKWTLAAEAAGAVVGGAVASLLARKEKPN